MNTMHPTEIVESLDSTAIRSRLDELRSEEAALRTLLRAAQARERIRSRTGAKAPPKLGEHDCGGDAA